MSDVSFNEEPSYRYASVGSSAQARGGIKGMIIKLGIARTDKEAEFTLAATAVIALLAAIFIFFSSHSSRKPAPPPLPPGVSLPAA